MITFESGGGLGNQIFQYVVARLLAERLGYKLGTECPMKVRDVLNPTSPEPGACYTNDLMHIVEDVNTEDLFERDYGGNRHIHLEGFWQEAGYYLPNRDRILGYFKEKAMEKTITDSIVMHVRLGDYKIYGPKGNVLDPQYYLDCLKREKFNTLAIVTDQPGDPYFEIFSQFNPVYINGRIEEDFWFITGFDRIIMANSSFSWWAAFLSNATKIYVPKCWIRNSDDLRHDLITINNGKCDGTIMEAGFKDYENVDPSTVFFHE